MALILRCPACGALWRLSGDLPERCRCGECGTVFSTDKAETITVADDKLEARIAARAAAQEAKAAEAARLEAASREGEALMTKIAQDIAPFEGGASGGHAEPTLGRPMPAAAAERGNAPDGSQSANGANEPDDVDSAERTDRPRGNAFVRFLSFIVGLAAIVVIAAAALLYFHEPVLSNVPYLRPAYENVCTKLPCPGFVWAQPKAFETTAEIVRNEAPANAAADANETDAANAAGDAANLSGTDSTESATDLKRPDVRVTLRNTSPYPQRLPIIEMKLLDPAGDTIVQRILEPAEYGVTASPAVLPAGESMTVLVHVETPLPYDAAGAAVAPVEMQ